MYWSVSSDDPARGGKVVTQIFLDAYIWKKAVTDRNLVPMDNQ